MAIAFVNNVGSNLNTVNGTTITLVPAQNCGAGNLIALAAASGGGARVTGVTDTKGNAWQVDATQPTSTTTCTLVSTVQDAGTLTTTDTITVTFTPTGSNKVVCAMEFSGITTTGTRVDMFTSALGTTETSISSGATEYTTNPNDLVIGAFVWNHGSLQRTFTKGASFTAALEQDEGSGGFLGVALEYQIVSATGAYTADGTLSAAPLRWEAICATYGDVPILSRYDSSWINPAFRRAVGPLGLRFMAEERSLAGGASLMIGGGAAANTQTPLTLTASVTATAAQTLNTAKTLALGATATVVLARKTAKTWTTSAAATATLTSIKTKLLTLTASVTASVTLARQTAKTLTPSASATATLARSALRVLAASAPASATLARRVAKTWTTSATATATLASIKTKLLTLTASVTATATLSRQAGKLLAPAATATVTLARKTARTLTPAATATATLGRRVAKAFAASATTAASIATSIISAGGAIITSMFNTRPRGQVDNSAHEPTMNDHTRGQTSSDPSEGRFD